MTVLVRPLTPLDQATVLHVNLESVHHLAPMDPDEYGWFLRHARCAWAAEVDGEVAGFVLVLEPGQAYESRNYQWFSERHDAFLYLDRVAVDSGFRRAGVGTAIYDAVESLAAEQGLPVLLEVNAKPANEPSLAFHRARGYVEVGILEHPDGKVVSLQAKAPPAR